MSTLEAGAFTNFEGIADGFDGSNNSWTPIRWTFADDPAVAEMVLVPPGCFQMGIDDLQPGYVVSLHPDSLSSLADREHLEQRYRDQPVHEQCFSEPFWIDRTEFAADLNRLVRCPGGTGQRCDTWQEAQKTCALRGMRLPTEIEWEYVARGPDNLLYPWGNSIIPGNETDPPFATVTPSMETAPALQIAVRGGAMNETDSDTHMSNRVMSTPLPISEGVEPELGNAFRCVRDFERP